jgi:hypothetical protein
VFGPAQAPKTSGAQPEPARTQIGRRLDALVELVLMCARMLSAASGLLVLTFLSLLAWIAAVAVAGRARMAGRIELLLTSCLIWVALIDLPAYGLGWANLLYPRVLAAVSLVVSTVALCLCGLGRGSRAHFRKVLGDVRSLAKLPFEALVELTRLRGFALIGIILSTAAVLWTARLSYLGPPGGWDDLWYQNTAVGFVIQNHGFQLAHVPQSLADVNVCPRICETLNLWFAMFGGRRFLALPNGVMAIPLMSAVYLLIRRYTADREYGAACASAILLMPGVMLQLRSTNLDLSIMALTATALHFSTRPHLRLRDAWLAAGALGLLLGATFAAVAMVPVMALVLGIRLLARHGRSRPGATALTALGGAAVLLAIGAPDYLRNWHYYHSVFGPHQPEAAQRLASAIEVVKGPHRVLLRLLDEMLSPPVPGKEWPDIQQHGYGLGLPALVLPLGLLATVAVMFAAIASLARPPWRDRTLNVVYTAIPMLATAPFLPTLATAPSSPILTYTRYSAHLVIAFLLLTTWVVGGPSWERLRQGIGATLITTAVVLLWWASPRWCMPLERAIDLFGTAVLERGGVRLAEMLPEPKAVQARETELLPGDIVVFTDSYATPALDWNERYTNRIVWVPSALGPEGVLARAAELGAKWITVTTGSPEYHLLRNRTDAWQEVGHLSTASPAHLAFRRWDGHSAKHAN